MKTKDLIKFLSRFDGQSEVIFQDYNWNMYSGDTATGGSGGKPYPVIVVSPENEED